MPIGVYQRTKEQYKKINTPQRAKKISKSLKLLYKTGKRVCWTKGKKLSQEHRGKIKASALKQEESHNWKGNKAGYGATHDWIKKCFGKAMRCENRKNQFFDFQCLNKSENYQWAKKKGKRYSRKKGDYFQLCVSCHSKYDYRPKNRTCEVKGCGEKHKRYGFCEKHSQRFKKWGDPLAVKVHHHPIKYII